VRSDDLAHLLPLYLLRVLNRDDNFCRLNWLPIDVLQRYLALRVGAEQRGVSGVPGFRKRAQDRMGIIDGRGHQFWCLSTRIAEHHALIARTFVLVSRSIDALRDVGRLAMDEAFDRGVFPVEIFLFVADVANGVPSYLNQSFAGDRSRTPNLSCQHDAVAGNQRLDTTPCLWLGR